MSRKKNLHHLSSSSSAPPPPTIFFGALMKSSNPVSIICFQRKFKDRLSPFWLLFWPVFFFRQFSLDFSWLDILSIYFC